MDCGFGNQRIYPVNVPRLRGYLAKKQKITKTTKENRHMNESESNNLSYFYTVFDVMTILGVSKSTAYREIKRLNDELEAQDYITINGKVPRKYFMERLYC